MAPGTRSNGWLPRGEGAAPPLICSCTISLFILHYHLRNSPLEHLAIFLHVKWALLASHTHNSSAPLSAPCMDAHPYARANARQDFPCRHAHPFRHPNGDIGNRKEPRGNRAPNTTRFFPPHTSPRERSAWYAQNSRTTRFFTTKEVRGLKKRVA